MGGSKHRKWYSIRWMDTFGKEYHLHSIFAIDEKSALDEFFDLDHVPLAKRASYRAVWTPKSK